MSDKPKRKRRAPRAKPQSPEQDAHPNRGKGKVKYARFKNLDCYPEFHNLVTSGCSTYDVAKWLQEEKNECTDVSKKVLASIVARYRKSECRPLDLLKNTMPKVALEAQRKVLESLNEVDEINQLFRLQMERIEMGRKVEKQIGMLNPKVRSEIEVAANLLAKSHNIKMDLGVGGGRDLGTMKHMSFSLDVQEKMGQDALDGFKDTPMMNRVLSIANGMLELNKKKREEDIEDAEFTES